MSSDEKVIALYEEHESCRAVAEILGDMSQNTVRRVLIRHGIPRTHRNPSKKGNGTPRPSNCNTSACPALAVMLRTVCNMRTSSIAAVMGVKSAATVSNILMRRCAPKLSRTERYDVDIDAVERDYLAGYSTYILADKYGVTHQTVSKWMLKRGHRRGKGFNLPIANNVRNDRRENGRKQKNERQFAERVVRITNGTCEYVSGYEKYGSSVSIRCRKCGCVFNVTAQANVKFRCPECHRRSEQEAKQRRDAIRKADAESRKKSWEDRCAKEMEKDKICHSCGAVYHSKAESSKYCSRRCKSRCKSKTKESASHRRRARRYGVEYQSGITLRKLYMKHDGVCAICGGKCDYGDRRWGHVGPSYPSIDHIVALANGGSHTWENVQLACCMCNSVKSDRDMEEVTSDAEEQAVEH